ncbi:tail fiber protein [Escherichia phage flopper]|uniref:Tail fiber protein n=1 Tax=Escherichia phage flopper TaxID=2696397 RepID=A0A6B9WVR3_9CAUD|nr:tail fiber protein [Escherichia phage flopper]QHR68772.1 hypothetical protein flopper_30 [Escherichia phage flopper]
MAIRPKLNRVWTSNNSVARRDPGDEKYLKGWVAEIPTYQVLNYLQYKIDTTMLAQAERGIFEWGNDVSYGVGSLAWDETNKTIYVCTVASPNKTLRPSANSAQWSPSSIQVSRANYDSIVAAINAHIADVTTNPHKVTAAQIGAYNKSELDNIVANYRAMVQAHVTDYNNPHKLTATQVGAVPATGGEYTGEVTFTTVYLNDSKTAQIVNDGGLYLRNGSHYLGINGTTGNAETGTAASKSNIVTKLSFPGIKAAQEPEYACLEPDFQMTLINSINIVRGVGIVYNNSDRVPVYNQNLGGAFSFDASGVVSGEVYSSSGAVIGGSQYTIAFDYYYPTPLASTGWLFTIGLRAARVLVRQNGGLSIEAEVSTGVSAEFAYSENKLTPNAWNRIVATYDGTFKIYVNGVLVASQPGDAKLADSNSRKALINLGSYVDRVTALRNFRVWSAPLSAKQVSTL